MNGQRGEHLALHERTLRHRLGAGRLGLGPIAFYRRRRRRQTTILSEAETRCHPANELPLRLRLPSLAVGGRRRSVDNRFVTGAAHHQDPRRDGRQQRGVPAARCNKE